MRFDVVLEQFQLNILVVHLSEICWIKGRNCRLLTVLKDINICMYSEVYQLICFTRGMMIDFLELCILILVQVT